MSENQDAMELLRIEVEREEEGPRDEGRERWRRERERSRQEDRERIRRERVEERRRETIVQPRQPLRQPPRQPTRRPKRCYNCGNVGHIRAQCRSPKRRRTKEYRGDSDVGVVHYHFHGTVRNLKISK
nr:uncharacterized protein LOC131782203 [Pocillopora verrucosa]